MAPKDTLPGVLGEARVFLGPNFEFVMEGITGLEPSQALNVLDGLRVVFDWDQNIHLAFIEHLSNGQVALQLRN